MSTPIKEVNVPKLRRKGFTATTILLQEEELLDILNLQKPKQAKAIINEKSKDTV